MGRPTVDHNLAVDPDGGFAPNGSLAAASGSENVWGTSASSSPTATARSWPANPTRGEAPIGYREPTGVHW